ncbi:TIGR02302 family protein [Aureimonas mangrovi]|uniref:TIGR02302 family protein n=1 Tax=Aureimonas mangrovi TaxID=2758041 RepID=UPI00163DD9CC|nr:TIGR02302 family protein [Aureimonas mangrovi]
MADSAAPGGGMNGMRLRRVRATAFLSILAERCWPPLFYIAGLAALFLAVSWFGIFAAVPGLVRFAILGVFVAALAFIVWRFGRIVLPTRGEITARVEAESHLAHQPLAVQDERQLGADPMAAALWRAHQRRMAERLRALRGGRPSGHTERLDPKGLRALVAMLLVTAFAFSHGPNGGRIADAFRAPEAVQVASARVDAWVTPPGYTGRAPVYLTEAGASAPGPHQVPEGSVVSVRISDRAGASLLFTPSSGEPQREIAPSGEGEEAIAEGAAEYELPLEASGIVTLGTRLRDLGAWEFAVVPDLAPTIEFDGEPAEARNGALEIPFVVTDDYGVAQARATISIPGQGPGDARPLVAAPAFDLTLPRRARGEARGRTTVNLVESPYAGARVAMTLHARDDAGRESASDPLEMTLPERRFTNPLARAVVEQRRILALDANAAPRVVDMLDAVTLHGDRFIERSGDYLALRAVRERIAGAYDDAALLSAVDFLWEIALGIEDGNLSLAERRLRDAQENLAEALRDGASEEEIAELMDELRAAMQEFMQAMAEAMRNAPPQNQMQMGDAQELRPQDLDRMLDRIEDLARSGSREAAQQLLSELQSMMNNLQAMQQQGGGQQQQGESEAQRQMNELGEMLQRQQELMDQTFALGREQARRQMGEEGMPGSPGEPSTMTEEELREAMEGLQGEQNALQERLQALQEAMEGMGLEPSEGLGEAGEAMGGAAEALGEGQDGEAVGRQGQAMEALRRGAGEMMQQLQQAMGEGQGGQPQPGMGQPGPGFGPGQRNSGRDPLGRQRQTQGPDFGQDVEVPDEIDVQRARRILDEIRERLGDSLSPQLERDYLERLLRTP